MNELPEEVRAGLKKAREKEIKAKRKRENRPVIFSPIMPKKSLVARKLTPIEAGTWTGVDWTRWVAVAALTDRGRVPLWIDAESQLEAADRKLSLDFLYLNTVPNILKTRQVSGPLIKFVRAGCICLYGNEGPDSKQKMADFIRNHLFPNWTMFTQKYISQNKIVVFNPSFLLKTMASLKAFHDEYVGLPPQQKIAATEWWGIKPE